MEFAEQLSGNHETNPDRYEADAAGEYGRGLSIDQSANVRFAALVVARQQEQEALAAVMTVQAAESNQRETVQLPPVTDVSIAKALSEGTANPSLRASYIKAIVGMVLLVGVPYVVYREQINDVWSQTIGRMIDFSQEHDRMSPRPTESVPKTTP